MAMRENFALDINELLRDDGHWDRKIASDLAAEVKQLLGEEPNGIPEIRRFLAVTGFRALKAHLQEQVAGQGGEAAVRAAIEGMRDFAKQRPGLSAATFRNPITDCPAWREAATELGDWLCGLLAGMAIAGMDAQHALRVCPRFCDPRDAGLVPRQRRPQREFLLWT